MNSTTGQRKITGVIHEYYDGEKITFFEALKKTKKNVATKLGGGVNALVAGPLKKELLMRIPLLFHDFIILYPSFLPYLKVYL